MIRPLGGKIPHIPASAYVDPSAQVIGDVTLGERASIWPLVTVRGDTNSITIGDDTNIQDNSVLHADEGDAFKLAIGHRVTVGHLAMLHGCVIEDECLIGIGAIVLNGARIGAGSVIAAGSLIPEGMQVPPGSLVMGTPGKVKRPVTPEEQARFREGAAHYVKAAQRYREEQA
jgi:carbonic anhydrase/acetyltransferase-like protein (isoleucine patch superfamily)